VFGAYRTYSLRDVLDGASMTIMMSERVRPVSTTSLGMTVMRNNDTEVPVACAATYSAATARYLVGTYTGDTAPGFRWADGAAYFAGFNTILPPNSASCVLQQSRQNHWGFGYYTATSRHEGGVHCLMGDGRVQFISENINTGNQGVVPPTIDSAGTSPYGVWGALGTRNGSETVGEF
jgi:prepilin-type processing-associated H-X9-DG protein